MSSQDVLASEVLEFIETWGLKPDGALTTTHSSWVLPVRRNGAPAVLKVARIPDERRGYELMRWWNGDGAAKVLAFDDKALLLERAFGVRDLADMARSGHDGEACRILCQTAARLHTARREPTPDLNPLDVWFQPLFDIAGQHADLAKAAVTARRLLSEPRCVTALHGDLHHENVLDFGERGWLAIDPHGLLGERAFDFANIFTNPDLSDPSRPVGVLPGRLQSRLEIVAETAQVEPVRMLEWIVAWTGLSAAWFIGDGDDKSAEIDLAINGIASALLGL
ncbi:APH(6)-I family aminoglycoside O-phosphotransferase [Hyphomicrobium sp. LHD-15]|uniref:APH(6)-I family aminoglycoside O-phosphotransferase n=1 Tax=Hyphomicrobium sp. LHD-15 TaxID=3072142 RepID=UPI00280C5AE7|nr:APH(6)-I family aminoglycoside O-phosphotransferase [Hyphomicrobium sp. LHD-15]MDQ8697153.1 APH(6)-I family aminoglycoside O-phosphotransferase [Hyphomicrobium sp. LHD-15]